MCLVEIPAIECDAAPIDSASAGDSLQHLLKAADSAKKFRCHAYVVLEQLDEAARAETGFVRDFGNARSLRPRQKVLDGVFNDRLSIEHSRGALQQSQLHYAELAPSTLC